MRFKDAVKEAIQKNIEGLNSYASFKISVKLDRELIKLLYNSDVINDSEIESSLEKFVINHARRDYDFVVKHGKGERFYMVSRIMPEFLAYGLEKGLFTKKEIKNIPFEDDDVCPTDICR